MAAGLGFKDFVTGEVLTAADVDGYLMQGVWVFASAAARDAAVTSPQEGNFAYLKDTNETTYYTGSAWATVGGGSSFNGARVFDSGTQSISNATNTAITFNSESYDTNSYHSTVTNTSRLTVPSTGYYLFSAQMFTDANATGGRYLEIKKNGTTVQAMETGAATQASMATFLPITAILSATASDYFELFLYQTSGGTRNTYTSGAAYNSFSVQYLGA